VEKRKAAGTRDKHRVNVALVAGPARTGKAVRRSIRQQRREQKAALVRAPLHRTAHPRRVPRTCVVSCVTMSGRALLHHQRRQTLRTPSPAAACMGCADERARFAALLQIAEGLVDTHMEQAPAKVAAPTAAARAAAGSAAMQVDA
jgi:hypothetical protein